MAIIRGRFQPQHADRGKKLRINEQIRISPVRLIDENNEQIGVVELDDAKRRAREAGLDLVEVSGASRPPVCRIMDYGKWKYQQKKKEQKARSHSKHSELKEVRLRPKIDDHDLQIKTDKAREFLIEGNKVQFTMMFKGREMAHKEIGMQTLQQICASLAEVSKIESPPRMAAGKRMTMVLVPESRSKKAAKPAEPPAAPAQKTPPPAAPGQSASLPLSSRVAAASTAAAGSTTTDSNA